MKKNNKSVKNGFDFTPGFKPILTPANREAIEAAFEYFCRFDHDAAKLFLVNLALDQENAERGLKKLGLNFEVISFECIMLLRHELQYQYEQRHETFLAVNLSTKSREAYNELIAASDLIMANVVYDYCHTVLNTKDADVEKIINLLASDVENRFCGGLSELGFFGKWRNFLKPAHKQVGALLKAMYADKQEAKQQTKNLPFAGLDKKVMEAGGTLKQVPEKAPKVEAKRIAKEAPVPSVSGAEKADEKQVQLVQEDRKESQSYKKLTAMNVLQNPVLFCYFVGGNHNSLVKLSELGFDLNEVMAKKEKILALFEAVNDLER